VLQDLDLRGDVQWVLAVKSRMTFTTSRTRLTLEYSDLSLTRVETNTIHMA
jgi:hypothetical protein